jgi:hypothetical protein
MDECNVLRNVCICDLVSITSNFLRYRLVYCTVSPNLHSPTRQEQHQNIAHVTEQFLASSKMVTLHNMDDR